MSAADRRAEPEPPDEEKPPFFKEVRPWEYIPHFPNASFSTTLRDGRHLTPAGGTTSAAAASGFGLLSLAIRQTR